ncbi:MAG: two-component sensor histidine kinase, partial [Flavobacterium sp.]
MTNNTKSSSNFFLKAFLLVLPLFCFSQTEVITYNNTQKLLTKAIENWKNDHYEVSLKQSNLALAKAIVLKNEYLIAKSYNVIGVNFDDLFMLEKALFYYEKSLKYANKTSDDTLKGKIYNNLANIYFFEKKNYQRGIDYYKKSLYHTQKIADTSKMFLRKLNISWAYFEKKQFTDGEPYLTFLNKYKANYADDATLTILNMLNGMYSEYKNDSQNADRFYQKAIQCGLNSNEKYDLSVAYYNYSLFLAKKKNFEKAYEYSKKRDELNDALLNDNKIETAKNTGINLEVEEYKREISAISSNFKTKETFWLEQQTRNKKIVIIIVVISLFLLSLFYFLSVTEKLKQKNKVRELQNKIQQNLINATIDGQEFERKNIAAFLHDNISA